jgi:hypothetical protein
MFILAYREDRPCRDVNVGLQGRGQVEMLMLAYREEAK